jgi:hypothetical protein
VKRVVDLSNIHQHTKTCTKGKAGISGCRLGRPMTLQKKTEPRQIKPVKKLKKSEVVDEKTDTLNTNSSKRKKKNPPKSESVLNPTKKAKKEKKESLSNIQNEKLKNKSLSSKKKVKIETDYEILPEIETPPVSSTFRRNFSRNPIASRDPRLIIYEIKRQACDDPEKLAMHENDKLKYDALSSDDQKRLRSVLPSRNGMVVEYNPLTSALLGCNTNVSLLGSDAQAKAALSYLIKYVTKPPAELAHSLSLLYHCRKDVQQNPSVADDSGTDQRTAMHYLNRIVNKLNGAVEISAPMAAAAILGMPAETCTDIFWVAYVSAALRYVKQHPESQPESSIAEEEQFADIAEETVEDDMDDKGNNTEDDEISVFSEFSDTDSSLKDMSDRDDETDNELLTSEVYGEKTSNTEDCEMEEDLLEPMALASQNNPGEDEDADTSKADIYVTQDRIKAVPQHIHYAYRGEHLAIFSLYEYVALIDVIPMKKGVKTVASDCEPHKKSGAGRRANGLFRFADNHPLYGM